MQLARIDDLLRLGPNERIILEPDADSPAAVARQIASLANTQGGTIVFGVHARRKPKGVRNTKATLRTISRALELITPTVLIEPEVVAVDGGAVVLLDVPHGYDPPYTTADGHVPVRQRSKTTSATAAEAAELAARAIHSAALIPLDPTSRSDMQRLRPKSAAPMIDLEHILLKLERLIIANAELARKLDAANSWQSRLTDQLLGAVLGLVVSTLVFYLLGIG
ncbi:MAG: ATP-binding protein [Chloroflexota bacterium]|nr:ATP-binding protein [Chloroflexota bacterium]